MPPVEWTPVGQQEANPARQQGAKDAHEAAYEYAVKSRTHMWVAVVQYWAPDSLLDAYDEVIAGDSTPILDLDMLLGAPMVGCYVCEQPYGPRLRRRRCAGEPA